jgi:hypothetical protein
MSWHLSATAQARPFGLLLVAQAVPIGAEASQMPTRQSLSSAVQSLGGAEQVPDEHVPAEALHPLLPHGPAWTASAQLPVALSHVGAVWQSRCTHTTLFALSATQVPLTHLSFGVHASLSALHAAPSLYA